MTNPFTPVTEAAAGDYWKAEDWVNHLMIVRPITYQKEGFVTEYKPEGMDAVFCDMAVIDTAADDGTMGRVYRNSAVLQGYLKGTFKRYIGHTLVGTVILGAKQKGQKPPYQWMDLFADPESVEKAKVWVAANQSFLVQLSQVTTEIPAAVRAAQAAAAAAAARPDVTAEAVTQQVSTLAQLQAMAAKTNHHGALQDTEPPF